jgi:hypothetical protein
LQAPTRSPERIINRHSKILVRYFFLQMLCDRICSGLPRLVPWIRLPLDYQLAAGHPQVDSNMVQSTLDAVVVRNFDCHMATHNLAVETFQFVRPGSDPFFDSG